MSSSTEFSGGRILLIDDMRSIHEDFARILMEPPVAGKLQELGAELFGGPTSSTENTIELDSAYQGQEGLAMLEDSLREGRPYAVAFVDMRMPPGWDGLETIERLWAADPKLQVVVCTAYSDYSWDVFLRRLNATDNLFILKKPFDPIEVMQLARALAAKWETARRIDATMQQLHRTNEELERFAHAASQDLSEPVRKVGECAMRLRVKHEEGLGEDARKHVACILDGTMLLNDIIDALLAYLDAGCPTMPPHPVDMSAVMRAVASELAQTIAGKQAVVEADAMPTVRGDEPALTHVLRQLVANAIKFVPADRTPAVRVHGTENDAEWIFSVRDNGIGVDPEYFDRIFNLFPHLHPRGEYPGMGIGLAVCKKIVEGYGGRIWVESSPGQGATFSFAIPR